MKENKTPLSPKGIISAVRAAITRKRQVLADDWTSLLDAVERGDLAADEIAERLDALDRTADDLQRGLDLREQRRAWRAAVAAGEQAREGARVLEREIATATAALQQHVVAAEAAIRGKVAQRNALFLREGAMQNAERKLLETGGEVAPVLVDRQAALSTERRELTDRARPLQDRLNLPDGARPRLSAAERHLRMLESSGNATPAGITAAQKAVAEAADRVAKLETELAPISERLGEIDAEQRVIDAKKSAS